MPASRAEEREYYALNARVYPKFAPFYDLVASPAWRVRRLAANLAGVRPGSRVLDVATGTGAQALAFARRGANVLGIDIREEMLRRARRKGRGLSVTFERADATALPLESDRFDVSSVSFALHEMPLTIRERVVAELVRVTRPGGTILVVDYNLPRNKVWQRLVYHGVKLYERDNYAEFVRGDLRALLRDAGVEVIDDRPTLLGIARVLVGRKRERHDA